MEYVQSNKKNPKLLFEGYIYVKHYGPMGWGGGGGGGGVVSKYE